MTLEPCAHHGETPPCVDALVEAGVARVVAGQADPHPEHGGGLERLREAGIEVELVDDDLAFRCRQQVEEWRTWVTEKRPFVTYKVAVSLDGRIAVPDSRWVSGEDSRRLVHLMRAASDAVAVGMGTVRWENPRLDARGVPVIRQPRRLAFGTARCRRARSSSCDRVPSARSWSSSRKMAFSRSCSKAARRSRPRSSSRTWSTRCSCS